MRLAILNSIKNGRIDKRPYQGPAFLKAYIDQEMGDRVDMDIIMDLETFRPTRYDICGISTTSTEYAETVQIAKEIKAEKDIPVIVGGVHITSAPDSLDPVFDIGVVGEGEGTLKEILETFEKSPMTPQNLGAIPGIVYHDNGKVRSTMLRPFMDLTTFPDPYWSHIYEYGAGEPIIVSSRGCPFKCHFCAASVVSRGTVRFFSIEHLIRQIRMSYLHNPYGTQLSMSDDHFFINKDRLREFINKMKNEDFSDRITFNGNCRASSIDPEMCELMREARFTSVQIGFESASDKLLKSMNKKVSARQNIEAIGMLKSYGIKVSITSIIGFPEEDENDLAYSYNLLFEMLENGLLDNIGISILMPYPATHYWYEAIKQGKITFPFDWRRLKYSAFRTEFHDASEEYARPNLDFSSAFHEWWDRRLAANTIYLGTVPELRLKELMHEYQLKIYNLQVKRSPLSRRIRKSLETVNRVLSMGNKTFAIYGTGYLTEKYVRFADLNVQNFIGFTDSRGYAVNSGKYFNYPSFHRDQLIEKSPETVIVSAYSRKSMRSIAAGLAMLGYKGNVVMVHEDEE